MIRIKSVGDYSKAESWLDGVRKAIRMKKLEKYGQMGVDALMSATPVDTGETAASWYYKITDGVLSESITFCNSHVNKGVNIAIILQYGHGTRNGGYVVGRDYINPAIQPVFDKIADDVWKEVITYKP